MVPRNIVVRPDSSCTGMASASAQTTLPSDATNRNCCANGLSVWTATAHAVPTATASSGWTTLPHPKPSASSASARPVIVTNAGFT